MFRESSLYFQSDMMWMGPVAFRYYFPAVLEFVRSEAAQNDSDFIAHLASTLEFRLKYESQELQPVAEQLAALSGYIIENWPMFEHGRDDYGDVCARYQMLQQAFTLLR